MLKKDKAILFNAFEPILADCNFHASMIDQKQKSEIISLWKEYFMPKSQTKNEALWHTFSFDHYPHTFGEEAIERFNETYLKEFIIFSTYHYNAIKGIASFSSFLEYESLRQCLKQVPNLIDIYIIHKNFKWTFVIPHEKDFGPYYAVSPQ